MNTIRKSIMDAVVVLFNEKGMKFTMDDISKLLHISKKTIYSIHHAVSNYKFFTYMTYLVYAHVVLSFSLF